MSWTAWRLARRFGQPPAPFCPQRATLPAVNEAAALYVASAIVDRRRLIIAPCAVSARLVACGLVFKLKEAPEIDQALLLLDTARIEAAFPKFAWRLRESPAPAITAFCTEVFRRIAEPGLAGAVP